MLDLNQFTIDNRLKISKYIALQHYQNVYNQQSNQKQKYLASKDAFDHEYRKRPAKSI
tara:strand:+ start:799 stop:972 length:174 start_codon:yes stop_codon:yes gene_type:complete